MNNREHQIRERAYQLWERAGRPHGHGDDFWHRAALEIEQEMGARMANGLGATSEDPHPATPEPPRGAPKAKTKDKDKNKTKVAAKPKTEAAPTPPKESQAKSTGKKKKKKD